MDKILFIIYQDEIRFVPNQSMSCKQYFLSLGGNMDDYDQLIRGMITDGKVLFMKTNYQYDSEVVNVAKKCAPIIKDKLNMPHLITCCGIVKGVGKVPWKPALVLEDEDIKINDEQKELLERVEYVNTPVQNTTENVVLEIKNDITDEKFAKYASRFSFYLLLATIIAKVVLYYQHNLDLQNSFILLLVAVQIISLILCIFGYRKQKKRTFIFGLSATAALFLLLDIYDIVIGAITLLFTIDQKYIVHILDFIHNIFHKKKKDDKDNKENKENM